MSEYRTEEDTLGPVKIPAEALWGPQTERSRNNFPRAIGLSGGLSLDEWTSSSFRCR